MSAVAVHFVLDDRRVEGRYDIADLSIGSVVHVRGREDHPDVSTTPISGSVPYCVTWYAQSDRTIFLESRMTVAESDVHRVSSALGEAMPRSDIRRALYLAASQVPVGRLHLGDTWHGSIPGRCLATAERLQLVADLRGLETDTIIWRHSEALITYLALTCFDILGQSTGFSTFGNWLSANRRAQDVANLAETEPLAVARALHDQWLATFGTRNSFYRFINETLDDEMRGLLLESLEIKKYPLPPAEGALTPQSAIPTTDEEKVRYLYKIRNSFTHEARALPGKHPDLPRPPKRGRGQSIENGVFKNFATSDWPALLIRCVKFGLLKLLREQLERAPADLVVPDKLAAGPGRRSFA